GLRPLDKLGVNGAQPDRRIDFFNLNRDFMKKIIHFFLTAEPFAFCVGLFFAVVFLSILIGIIRSAFED
ncbi:hypothetical protein, partial [Lacihabitans soyangensis]